VDEEAARFGAAFLFASGRGQPKAWRHDRPAAGAAPGRPGRRRMKARTLIAAAGEPDDDTMSGSCCGQRRPATQTEYAAGRACIQTSRQSIHATSGLRVGSRWRQRLDPGTEVWALCRRRRPDQSFEVYHQLASKAPASV